MRKKTKAKEKKIKQQFLRVCDLDNERSFLVLVSSDNVTTIGRAGGCAQRQKEVIVNIIQRNAVRKDNPNAECVGEVLFFASTGRFGLKIVTSVRKST